MRAFLNKLAPLWQPHPGQREFLLCRKKIRVLACGRRWGKTDACAVAILDEVFGREDTRHLILAPTLDQAKLLFDRFVELFETLSSREEDSRALDDESRVRKKEHKVSYSPHPTFRFRGHTVVARSGHVGRSLRGNEATHVIVDEAAFVPEELVTEVAMPMLATNDGRLTLISTPNGLNHFWKFFQMGLNGEHGVWSRTSPSAESPYVSAKFLKVQRELISERAFQIEYEAKFVDLVGSVFGSSAIEDCARSSTLLGDGLVYGGVDWGRYQDFTAVAVVQGTRQDARVLHLSSFQHQSWPDMVKRAADILRRFSKIQISSDGTGSCDSVTGMLEAELGQPVDCVVFTHARKQQLIEGLRVLLERRAIQFEPSPELIKQLKHFETRVSASGNQIMNAQSGYHDDLVIALALACEKLVSAYSARIFVGRIREFARSRLKFEDIVWRRDEESGNV